MLEVGSDYELVDGRESIAYQARLSAGQFALAVPVANVLRRVLHKDSAATADGAVARAEVVFHVWVDQLTAVPKIRDEIEDAAGVRWLVIEVDVRTLASRYRLTCQRKR